MKYVINSDFFLPENHVLCSISKIYSFKNVVDSQCCRQGIFQYTFYLHREMNGKWSYVNLVKQEAFLKHLYKKKFLIFQKLYINFRLSIDDEQLKKINEELKRKVKDLTLEVIRLKDQSPFNKRYMLINYPAKL